MKPVAIAAGLVAFSMLAAQRRRGDCAKYKEARDPRTNRENKLTAVERSNYGPDPFSKKTSGLAITIDGVSYPRGVDVGASRENRPFWQAKADRFGISLIEAADQLCGNCKAFDVSPAANACGVASKVNIKVPCAKGGPPRKTAARGYCMAWRFQCSALRTCDNWGVGGPHRG